MQPIFVYAGSFCPPTYGHQRILRSAAESFPNQEIIVLCSRNPKKYGNWFTEEECRDMWQAYELPEKVRVVTFTDFMKEKVDTSRILMIRGLRNERDIEEEKQTMLFNKQKFNITKYLYVWSDCQGEKTSSTRARQLAEEMNFVELNKVVAPLVISKLLESVLHVKNVFLVAGGPGSGKSTFLSMLTEFDEKNIHINTDNFNKQLLSLLEKELPGENLEKLSQKNDPRIGQILANPWFQLLRERLRSVPRNSNVFIEVPYALRPGMDMYKYLGGRILFVECQGEESEKRLVARKTAGHLAYLKVVPDKIAAIKIAYQERLVLRIVQTDGSKDDLKIKARKMLGHLEKNPGWWNSLLGCFLGKYDEDGYQPHEAIICHSIVHDRDRLHLQCPLIVVSRENVSWFDIATRSKCQDYFPYINDARMAEHKRLAKIAEDNYLWKEKAEDVRARLQKFPCKNPDKYLYPHADRHPKENEKIIEFFSPDFSKGEKVVIFSELLFPVSYPQEQLPKELEAGKRYTVRAIIDKPKKWQEKHDMEESVSPCGFGVGAHWTETWNYIEHRCFLVLDGLDGEFDSHLFVLASKGKLDFAGLKELIECLKKRDEKELKRLIKLF